MTSFHVLFEVKREHRLEQRVPLAPNSEVIIGGCGDGCEEEVLLQRRGGSDDIAPPRRDTLDEERSTHVEVAQNES